MKPHVDLKDVPMAIERAKTTDDREVMEVVFAKFGMSRPFFAPPSCRLNALQPCAVRSMRQCETTHFLLTPNISAWRSTRSVVKMSRCWLHGLWEHPPRWHSGRATC